ncbi:ArsR/SmtB family transcription factor [Corynebacterium kalidii]|uniref:Metalloregulator ArsR/SmtB family transcription factor n=1 Tax=Corynebacterium kalidii TaxID=2931982 RepID=A0A9X1WJV0_9CORY|nr:metalloregulator ArsR/SmtB family transcription factor [Corynebacterium kalidii]MCJ7858892.1 metalloregulator ArsR/SmtB family transcription factor [Corynebacterium kalidii]
MDTWNSEEPDKASVFEALSEVVKAAANGRRLELLELMAQGEHSVDELARLTGMATTTTSAHLQTMHRAGMVSRRRERTSVFYQLSGDDVAELYTATKRVALNRYPRLRDVLDTYMDQPVSRGPVIDPAAVTSSMFIIDVRPAQEYDAGHFPNALSFPMDELDDRLGEIPRDAEIVVYCRGELCRLAREAAHTLRTHGFNARAMDEGVVEWRASKGVDLDVA